MKKCILTLTSLVLLTIGLPACDSNDISGPDPGSSATISPSMGEIHNEFLATLYDQLEAKSVMGEEEKLDTALNTARILAERYGIEQLTREQVARHIEQGRKMAQQDPVKLVRQALADSEYQWWDRFAGEAKIDNARVVYRWHCKLYGTPKEGSRLARFLSVALSSAEFWCEKRAGQKPIYQNPYIPSGDGDKGWTEVIRFACAVIVDSLAGAAAGAGAGAATGPVGAAAAAGIVGGLASHGADDLLFGN